MPFSSHEIIIGKSIPVMKGEVQKISEEIEQAYRKIWY
jgi:hypothetical protein